MVYAASKDALRRKLDGIYTEIQCTDLAEVSHETVLDKVLHYIKGSTFIINVDENYVFFVSEKNRVLIQ